MTARRKRGHIIHSRLAALVSADPAARRRVRALRRALAGATRCAFLVQNDPFYEEYFDIADIPQHYLREVEHFFHIYKDLEGKRVQTIGWEQAPYAMQVIREAMERYDEKFVVQSGP